jgi:hypothetical protein
MVAKQLSVFIENRQGRLGEVLKVLKENNINILSLSLADTTEYGLLRLIVNNPELGKEKLTEDGFSTILTDVIVLKITHQSGSLQGLLKILSIFLMHLTASFAICRRFLRVYSVFSCLAVWQLLSSRRASMAS